MSAQTRGGDEILLAFAGAVRAGGVPVTQDRTHEFLAELAGLNDIGRSRPLVKRLVDAGVIVPLVRGIFVHAAPERPRPSLATLINWRCGWHDGHLAYASAIRVHDREGSTGAVVAKIE